MLAAYSVGISSVWIHSLRYLFASDEGKALNAELGIPAGYTIYASGAFGYNAGEVPVAAPRREGTVTILNSGGKTIERSNLMDERLTKYAHLIVKTGVNLQPGQTLVLTSPIECAGFARLIAEGAYKEGAREVVMQWQDELSSKTRFLFAPDEVFNEFPQWRRDFYLYYVAKGAAFVSIAAQDPELLSEVNPTRIVNQQKASNTALVEYHQKLMNNENSWCVVSMPTKAWAQKVFPGQDNAEELLLEAILKTIRIDCADPVAAWAEHVKNLQRRREFLNKNNLYFCTTKTAAEPI